jgi:hypothetical protein
MRRFERLGVGENPAGGTKKFRQADGKLPEVLPPP